MLIAVAYKYEDARFAGVFITNRPVVSDVTPTSPVNSGLKIFNNMLLLITVVPGRGIKESGTI